jgi:hypothetical protein
MCRDVIAISRDDANGWSGIGDEQQQSSRVIRGRKCKNRGSSNGSLRSQTLPFSVEEVCPWHVPRNETGQLAT